MRVTSVSVKYGGRVFGSRDGDGRGSGCLTCALISHQILALRLVRVDGCDSDGVLCVGIQVLQNMGGLIAVEDGLVTDGERERKTFINSLFCYNNNKENEWRVISVIEGAGRHKMS